MSFRVSTVTGDATLFAGAGSACAETTTVDASGASSNRASHVRCSPAVSAKSRSLAAICACSMRIVYLPGGSSTEYEPSAPLFDRFAIVLREMLFEIFSEMFLTTICASATPAPLRSVTRPEIVAFDCAWIEFEIRGSEKPRSTKNTNSRTRSFIFILRLPLAREFEGCPEIQAGVLHAACIRDGNSAGLLAWRHSAGLGLPAAVSRLSTKHRSSGARPTSSALQSRSGDGFTPSSRARSLAVIVARQKFSH